MVPLFAISYEWNLWTLFQSTILKPGFMSHIYLSLQTFFEHTVIAHLSSLRWYHPTSFTLFPEVLSSIIPPTYNVCSTWYFFAHFFSAPPVQCTTLSVSRKVFCVLEEAWHSIVSLPSTFVTLNFLCSASFFCDNASHIMHSQERNAAIRLIHILSVSHNLLYYILDMFVCLFIYCWSLVLFIYLLPSYFHGLFIFRL